MQIQPLHVNENRHISTEATIVGEAHSWEITTMEEEDSITMVMTTAVEAVMQVTCRSSGMVSILIQVCF